ncbi:hypothetical protein [Rhizobium sp. AN80A]|uniref:hypothetical protein n=1 Tax=Rhizobium sp. AN80A TaxID=3040673 RepID=UPI0024B34C59|nr:hypothetical protein [Rhizobium sp. AN80A]
MSQLLSAASDKRVTSAMRGDIDLLYMDCPARKPGGIKEKGRALSVPSHAIITEWS